MQNNNLARALVGIIIAIVLVVVVVLFANGIIQRKWQQWRAARNQTTNSVGIVPAPSTTPLPATVAEPTPGAPSFTSYAGETTASPTATSEAQTGSGAANQNLPQSGPPDTALLGGILVVLAGTSYVVYQRSKLRRTAEHPTVL